MKNKKETCKETQKTFQIKYTKYKPLVQKKIQ